MEVACFVLVVLLCLVGGWRTAMFQLPGSCSMHVHAYVDPYVCTCIMYEYTYLHFLYMCFRIYAHTYSSTSTSPRKSLKVIQCVRGVRPPPPCGKLLTIGSQKGTVGLQQTCCRLSLDGYGTEPCIIVQIVIRVTYCGTFCSGKLLHRIKGHRLPTQLLSIVET